MIVWGGSSDVSFSMSGGIRSNCECWTATTTVNAPAARAYHTGVRDGSERSSGADWRGHTFSITAEDTTRAQMLGSHEHDQRAVSRYAHKAVWAATEMIIWRGVGGQGSLYDGKRSLPKHRREIQSALDSWAPTRTGKHHGRYHNTLRTLDGTESCLGREAPATPDVEVMAGYTIQ